MMARPLIIALLLLLAGCGRKPGVYDIDLHEAYRLLAANELKEMRAAEQCGLLIQFLPTGVPDRSVTWAVVSEDEELFHFTANLAAVGDNKTRVSLDVSRQPEDPADHEAYDGSQDYFRPAMQTPARPRIEEAIAAILEDRSYDPAHVKDVPVNDICVIQRGRIESGDGAFSVHDQLGDH